MLNGLPDRPLYGHELEMLMEGDAIRLALPATPESIDSNEDGQRIILDIILFIHDSVAAIAYVADQGGWTLIAKEQENDPYETVFNALVEYRGYTVECEADVRAMTQAMVDILSPDLSEFDIDALEE